MLQTKFEELLASSFEVTAKKIGCRAKLQGSESEKLHGFMTFHFFVQRLPIIDNIDEISFFAVLLNK